MIARKRFILRPNIGLYYSVDPAFISSVPLQYVEVEQWNAENLDRFYREKIKQSAAYQHLISEAADPQYYPHIEAFARRTARDSLSSNPGNYEQDCDWLLRELCGLKPHYWARLWLTGIQLQGERIQVSDRLSLRKPRSEDMQEMVPVEH